MAEYPQIIDETILKIYRYLANSVHITVHL